MDKLDDLSVRELYFTFPGDTNPVCGDLFEKLLVGKHDKSDCVKPGAHIQNYIAAVIEYDLKTVILQWCYTFYPTHALASENKNNKHLFSVGPNLLFSYHPKGDFSQ